MSRQNLQTSLFQKFSREYQRICRIQPNGRGRPPQKLNQRQRMALVDLEQHALAHAGNNGSQLVMSIDEFIILLRQRLQNVYNGNIPKAIEKMFATFEQFLKGLSRDYNYAKVCIDFITKEIFFLQ